MSSSPLLFRDRQFDPTAIVTCMRWRLSFSQSLPEVEELLAERGLSVDHTSVWRWVQAYAPEIRKRWLPHVKYKRATWFMDETCVRVAGRWLSCSAPPTTDGLTSYLSETRDREAAKQFLKTAPTNPDNRPPHVMSVDGNRSYPAAIRELKAAGERLR